MRLLKDIQDINFVPEHSLPLSTHHSPNMEVSEPIVMQSGAGSYIGSICRRPYSDEDAEGTALTEDYLYEPYDRYTVYYGNSYEPEQLLRKSQDTNPTHREDYERCSVLF